MIPFLPIPPISSFTPMTTGVYLGFPCRCYVRINPDDSLTPMRCPAHLLPHP